MPLHHPVCTLHSLSSLLACFLLSATALHPQKTALCITLFGIFIPSHKLSLVSTSRALTLKSLYVVLTSSIYMQLLLGISAWKYHRAPQSPKSQGKTHCPWKFISTFFLILLIDISSEIIKQNFTFSFPFASCLFCAIGFFFMTFFQSRYVLFSPLSLSNFDYLYVSLSYCNIPYHLFSCPNPSISLLR